VERAARDAGVPFVTRGEGYGPSDHTSFYVKDVPVLHLFTNTHADYHKPTDDWEKIDAAGLAKVAHVVAAVATAGTRRGQALTLRRGAGQPPPPPGSAGSGYGAYLGTVPDFTPVDRGVKLSGVTAGSPAEKGGIRGGDVIVKIGDKDIADLQAMTDALRAHKPGETVTIGVLRDGSTRVFTVTLGDRASLRQ
jgi:membrane-associated protease RseP (regulator of RpoE activity)